MGHGGRAWSLAERWTAELAREALAAQERSGWSVAEFAAREGLSALRLERWRRRLGATGEGVGFVEVTAAAAASRPAGASSVGGAMFEVVVATGRIVRVPPDFDAEALQRLLAVLEGGPC